MAVVAAAVAAPTQGSDDTTPGDAALTLSMWPDTELGRAMVACFDPDAEFIYVPDEDTLTLEGVYQSDFVTAALLACVLDGLDVPQRVVAHIDQTRALDGLQQDSWGGYNAQWTYHPDDGLTITIWREDLPTEDIMILPEPTTTVTTTSTVPPTTSAPSTTASSPAPSAPVLTTGERYTVVQGDTLFGIAVKLNVELSDLLTANGLTETSLLVPGQQLVIPLARGVDAV